ncbi:hypothetical protein CCAN11_280001 [Capnocytophaga canimorsus]|uniref:Uncharacterized protein n=1 Tax=Capnocytophaga canimorsus TaxID=28188 RepID=A0A0B7ILY2_9FLAO|nr:hypothetical protein CCAN11_280001 [Capnocytophaga canimorsus]
MPLLRGKTQVLKLCHTQTQEVTTSTICLYLNKELMLLLTI